MRQNKQSFSILSLWRWLFLLVALVSLYFVVGVNIERTLAQQPNANSAAQRIQTKRLTPLRTSETPDGSRVRITSDGELNDYSAYRSGDRFIVIVPQAEGAGSGARGRGFKGAQVERRGTDLVYTFKLQPGATARVNQRFNRLDVQFSAPRAAGGQSLNNANVRPAATLALKPTRRPLPEEAGIIKPRANAPPTPAARRPPDANANNVAANISPTPLADASLDVAALPGVAPTPVLAPTSTPLNPGQLAQAQPTSAATVSITTNASATTSPSVGAVVLRNWPWLIAALLAVGIGLLFVTRFSGGDRDKIEESPTVKTKSIADETKAAHEETKVTEVDETNTLAVAVPLMEPALTEEATTEVETATTRVETDLASSAVEPYSTPSESIAAGVSELTTETPSVEPQPAPPVSETSRQGPVSLFDSLEIETSETNVLKPTPIAEPTIDLEHFEDAMMQPLTFETHSPTAGEYLRSTGVVKADKDSSLVHGSDEDNYSIIPKEIQMRLASDDSSERAASLLLALSGLNTDEAFSEICAAFDDSQEEVRNAAARALYDLNQDRAESFARALRESPVERRRRIGAALAGSGLADEAIGNLTGESRDKTYDAFSLLFLMAKAGEGAPLIRAIESHADNEVRLAVVKLLALSGQQDILPAFRRLAVRGSLPAEVRFAVMEAIYQISSQLQNATPTAS